MISYYCDTATFLNYVIKFSSFLKNSECDLVADKNKNKKNALASCSASGKKSNLRILC